MAVLNNLYDLDVGSARLFLAVEELGSVSKAARRCGLSQPSATARLVKLEGQLGVQLLERGPTGSVVTTAGYQLLPRCSALVAAATELADEARSVTTVRAPVLTVAAPRHVMQHHMANWLAGAELADADVRLTECTTSQVASQVRSGEVTIGFLAGPNAPLGLRSEQVHTEELVAVVAPSHRWAQRKRRVTPVELASANLIMRSAGSGTRDVIALALAQHGFETAGAAYEVSSDLEARLAAINGKGIAIVPAQDASKDIDADRLTDLALSKIELRQPIRIAWKGNRPSTEVARRLLSKVGAQN